MAIIAKIVIYISKSIPKMQVVLWPALSVLDLCCVKITNDVHRFHFMLLSWWFILWLEELSCALRKIYL